MEADIITWAYQRSNLSFSFVDCSGCLPYFPVTKLRVFSLNELSKDVLTRKQSHWWSKYQETIQLIVSLNECVPCFFSDHHDHCDTSVKPFHKSDGLWIYLLWTANTHARGFFTHQSRYHVIVTIPSTVKKWNLLLILKQVKVYHEPITPLGFSFIVFKRNNCLFCWGKVTLSVKLSTSLLHIIHYIYFLRPPISFFSSNTSFSSLINDDWGVFTWVNHNL